VDWVLEHYGPAVGQFVWDAICGYPEEVCGVITTAGEYVKLNNIAQDKRNRFEADPLKLAPMVKQKIIAVMVHSHIDGPDTPTAEDMQGQIDSGVPWGVVTVGPSAIFGTARVAQTRAVADLLAGRRRITTQDEAEQLKVTASEEIIALEPFFWGDSLPIPPYLERPFRHGVLDCYSLIRHWYKLERGILLPDCPRNDGWWKNGLDLYRDNFPRAGFESIDHHTRNFVPMIGDVLLYQIDRDNHRIPFPPHHAGLYVGLGLVLHHLAGHASNRLPVHRWWKNVTHCLRIPK